MIIFFISIFYLTALSNTIFGGDAGDLVSAIITKGFPHPPGYPLYTLLGIFFNTLPLPLTPAGKITILSALATVLSLFLVWQIIREIADKKYFHLWLALVTILVIGFNYIVWLYAIVPEVFPLNSLIVLFLFYCVVKYYKTTNQQYLYLLFLFLGLGISHHHTFILSAPALGYLLYQKKKSVVLKKDQIIKCVFFLLIGLLPLLYLFYAYQSGSDVLWGTPTTFFGFLKLFSRQAYGSFQAGPFVQNIPQQRLLQLQNLLLFTKNDYLVIGVIVLICGLWFCLRLKKSATKTLLLAVLINIVFYGPFFFFYANFPLISEILFATLERFLLIYYLFFGIVLYFGLFFIYNFVAKNIINRFTDKTALKKYCKLLLIVIFLIHPLRLFFQNFPALYALKNDRTAENLGRDVLQNANNNSLILLSADTILFNTQYVYYSQTGAGKNKILVHPLKLDITDHYADNLKKHYPQFSLPKGKLTINNLISENKERFSIYSDILIRLNKQLTAEYVWIPQGILYKLEKRKNMYNQANINRLDSFWRHSLNKNLAQETEEHHPKFKNFFTAENANIYVGAHQDSASYYIGGNTKLVNKAFAHIQTAIKLKSNDPHNFFLLAVYYEKTKICQKAETAILKAMTLAKKLNIGYLQELQRIGEKCYTDKKDQERIKNKLKQFKK